MPFGFSNYKVTSTLARAFEGVAGAGSKTAESAAGPEPHWPATSPVVFPLLQELLHLENSPLSHALKICAWKAVSSKILQPVNEIALLHHSLVFCG